MKLTKGKNILEDFKEAIQHEWLETNGLGGWASSSVIGCNTRRYHGLLVAATRPPTERMSLVSKLDETIIIGQDTQSGQTRYELGVNDYGDVVHPTGNEYQTLFTRELFPEFIYEAGDVKLKKTIAMVHGENTTLVIYEVLKAGQPFSLELLPLISARGYHSLQHSNTNIWWDVHFENGVFRNQPHENSPAIFISVPGSTYHHQPAWFNKFNYAVELYRGLDHEEDLFNHGRFLVELKEGDSLGIIISTENPVDKNAHELLANESLRRQQLFKDQPKDETLRQLILAADQFIVKRGKDLKTVIAGYHWFTDWGRDTMISLPGLCLSTGRFEDAKKIIAAFAKNVSQGMLPNRFQDNNEPPEYNNVDGTLWYFLAVYKYFQASGDKEFVLQQILPVLKDIIDWHYKGTRYNIHVTEDGLLYAGEMGQQLTWMDARIGDWVVTPRMGKPVEIQALWYNVLKIFAELLELNGQSLDSSIVDACAEKAKQNFNELFWYEKGGYLYDVIDENGKPDESLRPNQLFAISLPFDLIGNEKAKAVLAIVKAKLFTPVGLKSLTPDDSHYVGNYGGDSFKRDSSYHQGTVWSWLLGPYVDAIIKTGGENAKVEAMRIIEDFKYHLNEGCIGSVSEIMDAEGNHHPRGCIAQAWGVAELLRVIKEYRLTNESPKPTTLAKKLSKAKFLIY